MTALVFLIDQLALGLYILIGVGVFLSIRGLLRAHAAYRQTYFELERDIARGQQADALTILVLLIEVALMILGIQRVVAPTVRDTLAVAQTFDTVVEDGLFITPTASFLEGGVPIDASGIVLEEEDPAQRVLATPTLTPTPVGTIIPNAPAPIGCNTDNAMLQIPANGMVVFEPIAIVGRAYTDNFAFYRFEIKGETTFDAFAVIGEYTSPVEALGELGQFIPAFYEPGKYQFRVTVFDSTNTVRASCEQTIYISDPIPTPTPLGLDLPPNQQPQPGATPEPSE